MMLRVLSLWQPWASLCVLPDPDRAGTPPKAYETRAWRPRHALPIAVAIHATATRNAEVRAACDEYLFRVALTRCGANPDALPYGAIVGVGVVTEVFETAGLASRLLARGRPSDGYELRFGDYAAGRFAWRLRDAIALAAPIPFKGRQEPLYALPADVQALVDAQIGAAIAAGQPDAAEGREGV